MTRRLATAALAAALLLAGFVLPASPVRAQDPQMAPASGPVAGAPGGDEIGLPAVVGTAFTYQGRLLAAGTEADGPYDFQFRLYDAAAGGVQIGAAVLVDNAAVTDGRFTVNLDFGMGAFGGGARWLDIAVRPGAGGLYTLLSPRQKLNPAPYALGMPNVYTRESASFVGVGRDFQISGNEAFGVRADTGANTYGGMYVETADATGWPFYGWGTDGSIRSWMYLDGTTGDWGLYNGGTRLTIPSGGGVEVENTSANDALRVGSSADDAIQIGGTTYSSYGVYIPSPGVAVYALWPNTAAASGDYALYTVDNIQAGNVVASAQTIVAKASGTVALQPGDVVAATGVAEPVPGGTSRLALVSPAGREATGVIGVVAGRMEWRLAEGKEAEGEMVLMPVDGAAADGDYVALVVLGVAEVRLERGAGITRGTRLTAADDSGRARALRTESLNGMVVSEGAPVVGVALEDARGRETVPVFVNLR